MLVASGVDVGGFSLAALVPLLALVGLVVVGVLVVARVLRERARRREALLRWATHGGFDLALDAPWLVDRWDVGPCGRGHSRRAGPAVTGRWGGRSFVAFEHRYSQSSGSGKNRRTRTYRHTVVVLDLPVALGRLEVLAQGAGHTVAGWFGAQDIEMESHEFNRRFVVKADSPRLAWDLLHARAQQVLLAGAQAGGGRELHLTGRDLVCWAECDLEPAEAEGRLRWLDDWVDLVPRFVWQAHGFDPAAAPDAATHGGDRKGEHRTHGGTALGRPRRRS